MSFIRITCSCTRDLGTYKVHVHQDIPVGYSLEIIEPLGQHGRFVGRCRKTWHVQEYDPLIFSLYAPVSPSIPLETVTLACYERGMCLIDRDRWRDTTGDDEAPSLDVRDRCLYDFLSYAACWQEQRWYRGLVHSWHVGLMWIRW